MSGIYQKQTNSATVKNPSANQTLISVDETGKIFTKDSSGNVTVYPTTGGGGSFTGGTVTGEAIFTNGLSANTLSSSTLNVNYSPTATFGNGNYETIVTEYINDFGGWVNLQFTGSSFGNIFEFANNEMVNLTAVGNTSIPGIPGISIPTSVMGSILRTNDGILSGSTALNGVSVSDQSGLGLGEGVIITNSIRTAINNTLSGNTIGYEVGTSFSQNDEYSDLKFSKTNEAGERIVLTVNDGASGLNLFSEVTDPEAELFRIIDVSEDFKNRLLVRKDSITLNHTNGDGALSIDVNGVTVNHTNGDGALSIDVNGVTVNAKSGSTENTFTVNDDEFNSLFNVHQTYGVTVNAKSGSTGNTFTVNDDEFNILFSVNQYISGPFNSQVDIFHDGKSDAVFRILDSTFDNYMYVSDSGSTSFTSALSGSGSNIFSVGNGSRTAFEINDINTTSINDPNLVLSNLLPTSPAGLSSGAVYTQTSAELGGSGTTKVLCIV